MRHSPWFAANSCPYSRIRPLVLSTQSDERNSSADKKLDLQSQIPGGSAVAPGVQASGIRGDSQREMKTCSARIVVRSPEPATVGLNSCSSLVTVLISRIEYRNSFPHSRQQTQLGPLRPRCGQLVFRWANQVSTQASTLPRSWSPPARLRLKRTLHQLL
jgi:hypothetical protein